MARAQLAHRQMEMFEVDAVAQAVVVTILDHAEVDVGARFDPAMTPVMIDAQARGDDGHPGIELALAIEAGQSLERLDERLLGELLGLGPVADAPLAERPQTVEIAAVEVVEGRRVARLPSLDEEAITC